jgi:hypothetical protein
LPFHSLQKQKDAFWYELNVHPLLLLGQTRVTVVKGVVCIGQSAERVMLGYLSLNQGRMIVGAQA